MNFLAHLYLSGTDEEIIIGNFIADHVKGRAIQDFSKGIQEGIYLHREIDTFTDTHPLFIRSKERLMPKYRKYSGVITDMFYDHFLSVNWDAYSDEPIDSFTRRMYRIVMRRFLILPAKTKYILPFMARDNWLKGYGTFEGLERALKGMDRRTPFDSGMGLAVTDLRQDYAAYRDEFMEFFPEIILHTNKLKKTA